VVSAKGEITQIPRIKNYIRTGWSTRNTVLSATSILRIRKFVKKLRLQTEFESAESGKIFCPKFRDKEKIIGL